MSDPRLDDRFRDHAVPPRTYRSQAGTLGVLGLVAAAVIIAILVFVSGSANQRVASDNPRPAAGMNEPAPTSPAKPPAPPAR
jgi:hypothetical protein